MSRPGVEPKLLVFSRTVFVLSINHYFSESFDCPADYFKCPNSFCLDSRFVCDGRWHCQHGVDEVACGIGLFNMPF